EVLTMRPTLWLLGVLPLLPGCGLFLAGPQACDEASFTPRCDDRQNAVVRCVDGLEIDFDCGDAACNQAEGRCGFCGDGIVQPDAQECDDSNQSDTDGCTNACQIAACGDGIVEAGVEECDDGNQTNGDGCDNNCTPSGCGNGIAVPGELCFEDTRIFPTVPD